MKTPLSSSSIIDFPGSNAVKFHDSLQLPTMFDPNLDSYKEWQHFNVFDEKNRLFLMLNFSLSGNIFSRRGVAATACIAGNVKGKLVYTVEPQGTEELQVSHLQPGMKFGENTIAFSDTDDSYHVSTKLKTIGVSADLVFEVFSEPISAFARPFGSGSIGWMAIPRMSVSGTVEIGKKTYSIKNAVGYHDHDWGYFNWGEPVGWEWGIFSENRKDGITIVVDQRTSGIRGAVHSKVVYVYKGRNIIGIFSADEVDFILEGTYAGPKEVTPGLMRILFPYQSTLVPKEISIIAKQTLASSLASLSRRSAVSRSKKITLAFSPNRLIQIIVPNPNGRGETQLNQLVGKIKARITINGTPIASNKLLGYMESVGPL